MATASSLSLTTLLLLGMLLEGSLPRVEAEPPLPPPPDSRSVEEATRGDSIRRVVARRSVTPPAASRPTPSPPAPPTLPREHHPWARFEPGAWRRVRIVSESFDANGRFLDRSEATQTETLKAVDTTTCTLEIISILEIGGKRLRGATQTLTVSLLCEEPCDRVLAERLDTANISLDGAVIPVERWSVQYGDEADRRSELIYYNPDRSPYILRRELQSAGGSSDLLTVRTVTRVDSPMLLDGGVAPTSHVSIASQDGVTQTSGFQVRCDAVPGGLVSASSTERNASGRRVRWSTVSLEDYGETAESDDPKRPWLPFRRLRKPSVE